MSENPKIVWQDPPANAGRKQKKRGRWVQVKDQLKKHPGKWALVGTREASSTAHYLETHHGLTVQVVEDPDLGKRTQKRYDIYAKYEGEKND